MAEVTLSIDSIAISVSPTVARGASVRPVHHDQGCTLLALDAISANVAVGPLAVGPLERRNLNPCLSDGVVCRFGWPRLCWISL